MYCPGICLNLVRKTPNTTRSSQFPGRDFPENEHQCYHLFIMIMKYPCKYKYYPVYNETRHQALADSDAKPPVAEAVLPHGRYIDLTDRSHNRPESIVRSSPESHGTLTPPNTSHIFVRHFAVQSDNCSDNNAPVSKFMSQNPQSLNRCTGCSKSRFTEIIFTFHGSISLFRKNALEREKCAPKSFTVILKCVAAPRGNRLQVAGCTYSTVSLQRDCSVGTETLRTFCIIQYCKHCRFTSCCPVVCGLCWRSRYGLDGPRIESHWEEGFSTPVQSGPGTHPTSCTMGTGSLLLEVERRVWRHPPTPSNAEDKERVVLYLYCPSGPS